MRAKVWDYGKCMVDTGCLDFSHGFFDAMLLQTALAEVSICVSLECASFPCPCFFVQSDLRNAILHQRVP